MSAHKSTESQPSDRAPYDGPVIEVNELQQMLEQRVRIQVLDVRPAAERAEWFIPESIHRDAYHALKAGDSSAMDDLPLSAAEPVVTVCARGRTSAIAAQLLRRRGYDAYSLAGGMKSWSLSWNTAELAAPASTLIQVRRTGKG